MSKVLDLSPIDYSSKVNWKCYENNNKDVDCIYIIPTMVNDSEYGDFASVDELRENSDVVIKAQASVYRKSCNLYVPLYRQAAFSKAMKCNADNLAFQEVIYNSIIYKDITSAFDYYFKNINNGKPFILAGHSQGSAIGTVLLQYYFKEHPEYTKLMVAAYLIGYAPSKKMLENNKHIRFASGETDAGPVIISWNTEGPNASGKSILLPDDALVINPLNWKLDDTYASVDENKGSFFLMNGGVCEGIADAQINLKRGTLVCTTFDIWTDAPGAFQSCSLHQNDYGLYYINLEENIEKRIKTYKKQNNL